MNKRQSDRICKNCKIWKINDSPPGYGNCFRLSASSSLALMDSVSNRDQIFNAESDEKMSHLKALTGSNFGCVHWIDKNI